MNNFKRKYKILAIVFAGLIAHLAFGQEKIVFNTEHDIDGDGKKDEISFDFSNGAHCCYTIYIKPSSNSREYHFPFDLDGGYSVGVDESNPSHFSIQDFDGDGKEEIFMEIATYNGRPRSIPPEWKEKYGVHSNYILFDFTKDSLEVINTPWVVLPKYYFKVRNEKPEDLKLTRFKDEGKYGYKNEKNIVVLPAQWEEAGDFQNGVALVRHFQRTWLINTKGEILKELHHKYVLNDYRATSGLYLLFDGMNSFYYMNSKGEIVNPVPLKDAKPFSEGLAAAMDTESELWGYVDPQMNWIIPPAYEMAHDFKNGKAFVIQKGGGGMFVDYLGKQLPATEKN